MRRAWRLGLILACVLASALPACGGGAGVPAMELEKEFSGARALAHVEKMVALGPRPSGTPALEETRKLIEAELCAAGWTAERQEFTDPTPRGPVKFANIIARFDGAGLGEPRMVFGGHYDTKIFESVHFLGANDGGSSAGALLELARVLARRPALARRVEIVFFDGEEAVEAFTATDGLYGSRHYGRVLRESGRARQFRFGIVWDMIGDRDLTVTLPSDSPSALTRGLFEAAEALGVRGKWGFLSGPVLDDHVPLNQAGIPTIDIIDFDYAPWHTAGDTLDKISAESMETVGRVTLRYLATRAKELE